MPVNGFPTIADLCRSQRLKGKRDTRASCALDALIIKVLIVGDNRHEFRLLRSALEAVSSVELTHVTDGCEAQATSLAAFGKNFRDAVDAAGKSDDMDASDPFIDISRAIDKMLWFVESHQAPQ